MLWHIVPCVQDGVLLGHAIDKASLRSKQGNIAHALHTFSGVAEHAHKIIVYTFSLLPFARVLKIRFCCIKWGEELEAGRLGFLEDVRIRVGSFNVENEYVAVL